MYLNQEILQRFKKGMDAAVAAGVTEPTAMSLATIGANNRVSSRIMLLKHYDRKGFIFFTNLTSRKGMQLSDIPNVALTFFWGKIQQQVRVEGKCEKISPKESDAYFATRPRISQVGAWVSQQSQPLPSRAVLESKVVEFAKHHDGQKILRPKHWGGIRIVPDRIEFWYGRKYRLHERLCYRAEATTWSLTRLYP